MTAHSAAAKSTTGTVLFCAPIIGSTKEDRAIVEIGDGTWAVGRLQRTDRTKLTEECRFSIGDLEHAALLGLQSDPDIATILNKQAGKALAAGALMLMMAIGAVQTGAKT